MTDPVTQMDPHQDEMDRLLRRSLSAPIPTLASDFDKRVLRAARTTAISFNRYRRFVLTGYVLASVLASAVVMRGQGLSWAATAGMILAPLILLAAARTTLARRFLRNPAT